jgi:RNA polymerase sigma-70 factor (ECF subfamily)
MQNLTEQAYKDIRSDLKSFITSRVGDKDLAEDILHDVFVKVHSNINKLKDSTKLNGWIYSITRNSINDFYKSKKAAANIDKLDIKDEVSEKSAAQKMEKSIRTFIKNLPPIYREAVILTDYRGITQTELAKRLNLSVSAAKSRVQRARKMLKEMLLECCHFEFDKFGTIIDYHPRCCNNCACAN